MTGPAGDHGVYGLTKARIEALTDGIFAFAMTLLVTSLDLPREVNSLVPNTQTVFQILQGNMPDLLHYVIAFMALAGFWVGHHMQFHALRFVDRRVIWNNIFMLLFVALVPFTASLVGDYPGVPLAAIVFEANLFMIGGFMFLQWRYATDGRRLVAPHVTDAGISTGLRRNLVLPVVSLAGILLALTGVQGTTLVYLAVPPLLLAAGEWKPEGPGRP